MLPVPIAAPGALTSSADASTGRTVLEELSGCCTGADLIEGPFLSDQDDCQLYCTGPQVEYVMDLLCEVRSHMWKEQSFNTTKEL